MLSEESDGNQIRYKLYKAVNMQVLDSCRRIVCSEGKFGVD